MVWRYLKGFWDQFRYDNRFEARPAGIFAFWDCLSWWWAVRPRLGRCTFCGQRLWKNHEDEYYCNEYCEYYGPYEDNDEIPF